MSFEWLPVLLFSAGGVTAVAVATVYWRSRRAVVPTGGAAGSLPAAMPPLIRLAPIERYRDLPTGHEASVLLAEIRGSLEQIPPIPAVVLRILQELARPDASADQIAELLAQEPVLSATLLRLVNSSAYGLSRKIRAIDKAVSYVGASTVRSLVLRLELGKTLGQAHGGYDVQKLWQHSLIVSHLAETLARRVGGTDASFAATLGLLHDLGKLAIRGRVTALVSCVLSDNAWPKETSLLDREIAVFGGTHAAIGAQLARNWALPEELVLGIEVHHTPADPRLQTLPDPIRRSILVVLIANAVAKHVHCYAEPMEADRLPEEIFSELGLPPSLDALFDNALASTVLRAHAMADVIG